MKEKLTFTPYTGLDVAKLLGPEAVKDYMAAEENKIQTEDRMKKDLNKVFEMFRKMEKRK